MHNTPTTFQFISEPTDVNFGGKVHGGSVMKWIDQVGYACASNWCGSYAVTVYVGGIRFLKPIKIGELIKINAKVIQDSSKITSLMGRVRVAETPKKEAFQMTEKDYKIK